MTGTGTIKSENIRDCKFLSKEEFAAIEKREFQIPPTGRRIGRTWLTLIRQQPKVWVHCEWIPGPAMVPSRPGSNHFVHDENAVMCDVSHLCVIEWSNE